MKKLITLCLAVPFLAFGLFAEPARAVSPELDAQADATLQALFASEPISQELYGSARGVLVFPEILRGGLVVGLSGGDGVLRVGGQSTGTYQSASASIGLQAGIASFGYVMFFMDDEALAYLDTSDGWEVGVGPNVTVADEGIATRLSTTTAQSGIYVFFVGQEGFFAGAGVEGTRITRISD